MKKILSVMLVTIMAISLFALTACGGDKKDNYSGDNSTVTSVEDPAISDQTSAQAGEDQSAGASADTSVPVEEPMTPDADPEEDLTDALKVTFVLDEKVTVNVFRTQDLTTGGKSAIEAYVRNSDTGELLSDGTGQINFILTFAEGYEIDGIVVDGTYNKIKGPVDTEVENGYRITKVESDLTITVTSKLSGVAEDLTGAFKATFVTDANASVKVFRTQDLTAEGEISDVAYARSSATGNILTDGEGQINFLVIVAEGFEVDQVSAEGGYKNLKGSIDTGVENGYRLTKVTGDVTVTITTKAAGEGGEQGGEEPPAEEDLTGALKATFVLDEHVKVLVFKTNVVTSGGEEATVAYARSGDTGELDKVGGGQINFVVVVDEGFVIDTVVPEEGKYNKLKGPDELGENTYRLTKVNGDLTITITTKAA